MSMNRIILMAGGMHGEYEELNLHVGLRFRCQVPLSMPTTVFLFFFFFHFLLPFLLSFSFCLPFCFFHLFSDLLLIEFSDSRELSLPLLFKNKTKTEQNPSSISKRT